MYRVIYFKGKRGFLTVRLMTQQINDLYFVEKNGSIKRTINNFIWSVLWLFLVRAISKNKKLHLHNNVNISILALKWSVLYLSNTFQLNKSNKKIN